MIIEFKGKSVGHIEGKTYITHREPIHFFRKFQGFGISEEILNRLLYLDIKFIKIIYHGKTGYKIFNYSIEEYTQGKIFIDNSQGFDKQYFPDTKTKVNSDFKDYSELNKLPKGQKRLI